MDLAREAGPDGWTVILPTDEEVHGDHLSGTGPEFLLGRSEGEIEGLDLDFRVGRESTNLKAARFV